MSEGAFIRLGRIVQRLGEEQGLRTRPRPRANPTKAKPPDVKLIVTVAAESTTIEIIVGDGGFIPNVAKQSDTGGLRSLDAMAQAILEDLAINALLEGSK